MDYRFFALVLIFFSAARCNKIDFEEENLSYLIGDYDWVYTKVTSETYLTPNEVADKYGLRITQNGFLETYKNGKIESSHKIKSGIDQNLSGSLLFYKVSKRTYFSFNFSADTIRILYGPGNGPSYYLKQ